MTNDVVLNVCAIDACIEHARAVLQRAVSEANTRRATAFDPMRGLYVTEAEVAEILARARASTSPAASNGGGWYIPELVRITSVPAIHEAVALAVAAEYIPRLDRVFGFLHDDLTRRSLSAVLLVEILALDPAVLAPDGLLARLAIFTVGAHDLPLAATVRIDRGFLAVLAGDRRIDARIRPTAREIAAPEPRPRAPSVPELSLVLWGAGADDIAAKAREIAAAAGCSAIRLDADATHEQIGIGARDALLRDAMLILEVTDPAKARTVAQIVENLPVRVLIEAPGGIVRYDGPSLRVTRTTSPVTLSPVGYPLPYGRRMLARRTMQDIILPPLQMGALRSIADRMTKREQVTADWGVDTGSSTGGVRALFAGPPGTGKTLAAEALAQSLGRDLYIVDVSMVVSKYIGETEKALATVFAEAARAGVCLFFDEADAFFGKRTETKDAHDRYANIETAYLLQALDVYPDIAILATNMAANIDDALVRRIDVKVEFPMPDAAARKAIWLRSLARAPLNGVDLADLAKRLPLSGGGIQSSALAAAYRAAAENRPIATLDLLRASRDELRKMGRVAGRLELGEEYGALRAEESGRAIR